MRKIIEILIITFLLITQKFGSCSRVLELSDRFLDIKKDGVWLIEFYAPWCGHCKKLEPIYNQVAQALHDTPIRVGRVDCNRFPTVAKDFNVQGYPTIVFLKQGSPTPHTYTRERTTQAISTYAKRMLSSAVKSLSEKSETPNQVYMLFTTKEASKKPSSELFKTYTQVAEQLQDQMDFYIQYQQEEGKEDRIDIVHEHEDKKTFLPFNPETEKEENLLSTLRSFIYHHRPEQLTKITSHYTFFNELVLTKKLLLILVIEEDKQGRINREDELKILNNFKAFVKKHWGLYRDFVQFSWSGEGSLSDVLNYVVMRKLEDHFPCIVGIDASQGRDSLEYWIFEDAATLLENDDEDSKKFDRHLIRIIDVLRERSISPHGGGSGWIVHFMRKWFEMRTNLGMMFYGNPVLSTLLFGLPLGFLSLICYGICCADVMDADDGEEGERLLDEGEEEHEKRE